MVALSAVLQESPGHLKELRISGMTLTRSHLLALSAGLQGNISLVKLDLTNNKISGKEGIQAVFEALEMNRTVETLDLSHNCLDSDSVVSLPSLLDTNTSLRSIILDYNSISTSEIAYSLAENEFLTCFSISNNPLTFECLSSLLDSLVNNRSLRFLGAKGCPMEGAAPIKENCNGLLSKQEVIILKLAHVLRYSNLTTLAVDVDVTAEVQLQELESTMIKHNRALTSLRAPQIDWNKVKTGPLAGIHRALKANLWLSQNEQLPRDQRSELALEIEELVALKARKRTPSESLGYLGELSATSSSEGFQRLFLGKHTRTNSPNLLRSLDSAVPVVASPENPGLVPLNMPETDSKPLVITAETPQFSPFFPVFPRLPSKIPHFEPDLTAIMDLSIHKETQTEPTPPNSHNASIDSKSANKTVKTDLDLIMEIMQFKDAENKKNAEDLADRVEIVEKNNEKVGEIERNWKEIVGKMNEISRENRNLSERLNAMEIKETSKLSLFSAIGQEIDTLKSQNSQLSHQFSTFQAKNSSFSEFSLFEEQLKLLKQEKEEENLHFKNRLNNLEEKEIQIDKLKYFIGVLQKDLTSKIRKIESLISAFNIKNLDFRLGNLEEMVAKENFKAENCSLQSIEESGKQSFVRVSEEFAGKMAKIEEKVMDMEREMMNFANVKKKIAEIGKKLKMMEGNSGKNREIVKEKQEKSRVPSVSPHGSSLTVSKLATSGSLSTRESRVKSSNPHTETSFGADSRPMTERGIGEFLPGEAESVVMGALLERTQRSKQLQQELKMNYRAISPVDRREKDEKPSADLQAFLREKGFRFNR